MPIAWVDRLFVKLTMMYGKQFLARWDGLDIDAVKCDWATELSGFDKCAHAIAYALQNLDPEKPPSVLMFRAIARRAPDIEVPALPAPKADPQRMAAELAKLGFIRDKVSTSSTSMKDWALRLKARHEAGELLSPNQVRCYKAALKEST